MSAVELCLQASAIYTALLRLLRDLLSPSDPGMET